MTSSSTSQRDVRRFGLCALLFFGALCAAGLWRNRVGLIWMGGLLAWVGFLLAVLPGPLRPVYAAWTRVGRCVGVLVTMITLTCVYYLVVTPTAFVKRRVDGAPLPLRPSKDVESYWISRNESGQPRERFLKRY